VELGIGESLLIKAIGESTGRSTSIIKAELKKEGDLGLVAMVSLPRYVVGKPETDNLTNRTPKIARRHSSNPKL
jgi:DNA ligase N terminus